MITLIVFKFTWLLIVIIPPICSKCLLANMKVSLVVKSEYRFLVPGFSIRLKIKSPLVISAESDKSERLYLRSINSNVKYIKLFKRFASLQRI